MSTLNSGDIRRILSMGQMRRGTAMNRLGVLPTQSDLTNAQRAFLQQIVDAKPAKAATRVPQHPDDAARLMRRPRKSQELTAVELTWLQRLPLEPDRVKFDDAVQLASLARLVDRMQEPASWRLVESIWGPVRALHDRRVAAATLASLRETRQSMPPGTLDALRDALAREHPNEHPAGIAERAREVLADITDGYDRKHAAALASAQARLDEAEQVLAQQQQTERDVEVLA